MNGPITRAAGQRYLCSGETRTWLHVAGILRELFPAHAAAVPAAYVQQKKSLQLVHHGCACVFSASCHP